MATKAKTPHSFAFTLALICTLIAVLLHGYLTYRHFEVSLGQSDGTSICNLSATFNCDTVAASSFSSFLGIPLALWGAVTNLLLLLLAFYVRLTWDGESTNSSRWTSRLAAMVFATSIIMGVISATQLKVYCPFCIATYVLSLATFWGFLSVGWSNVFANLGSDIIGLFTVNRGMLVCLLMIPAGSWVINGMLYGKYHQSESEMKKAIRYQIQEWKVNTTHDFSSANALSLGATRDAAKMVIVEFADFLCGHCKAAAPKLHAFVEAHKDVRLEFLSFPLDGACNPQIKRKVGFRCKLAKATFCAGDKSWAVHDEIFAQQEQLYSSDTVEAALDKIAASNGIDREKWSTCIESEATQERILAQSELGKNVGVQGTPAIYINGKKLLGGQNIPMLKAIYSEL